MPCQGCQRRTQWVKDRLRKLKEDWHRHARQHQLPVQSLEQRAKDKAP